ncbi:MAG TPA: STAS/SEC14 domain-containing protein [Flavobacteriales bacterium]
MSDKPPSRDTSVATLELISPGLIELRYKPTATFDPHGFAEISRAGSTLWREGPYSVMAVIPAEVQVDPLATDHDHLQHTRAHGRLEALALVTDSEAMHMAAKVYFIYHQQPFPVQVFSEEYDALKWLRARPYELGMAAG